MHRTSLKFLLACSLAIAVAIPASAPAQEAELPKILFLTHSQGFKHGSLGTAERVVKQLGRRSKAFEAVTLQGYEQDADKIDLSMISAEYLEQFAAVMFFTTGELPLDASQKKALIDFVRNGKAYIGAHSAADTGYTWKDYGELSGAYFLGHGANDEVLILKVEDTEHPATRMLGDSWPLADEFYQYGMTSDFDRGQVLFSRDRVRVLLSVDTEKSTWSRQGKMKKGGDYPLAWCQEFGKGRSFYTGLGHREDVWTSPVYQAHLLGGIKWALGLEPGDATPSSKR